MKQVSTLVLCAITGATLSSNAGPASVTHSRQCLVVTTDSWSATKGTLSVFERESIVEDWRQRGRKIQVVVGKAGMAWSRVQGSGTMRRGLDGVWHPEVTKTEGDKKAPAGVFTLRTVFGYAPQADTKMNYRQSSPNTLCIDDPKSEYYNHLIGVSKIDRPDWRTAEVMRRKDDLYKWGIVVDYNVPAMPAAGSCIFLHIWRGPGKPTVGCTAMSEKDIIDLIHWLDPAQNPVLVQLPQPEYDARRQSWNLPPLP